jgi:hypothetical protein
MPTAERETAVEAPVPVRVPASQPGAPALARLAVVASTGGMSAADTQRLQRLVGNRAVRRILAREDKDKRPMQDTAHPADQRLKSPSGHEWVWDPFDNTVTIFMPENDPRNPGGAVQLVYGEGTPDELAKLPNLGLQSALELSKVRARILDFLRANEGTYQTESDEAFNKRVAIGATMCNAFVSALTSSEFSTKLGGMDPRADAISAGRGGAFHTIWERKEGPKPGDIIAYGKVLQARTPDGKPKPPDILRRADFTTVTHVGFLKSRRLRQTGQEIWTVVDGGQPDPMGTKKNIVQERTRTFAIEDLEVQIPNRFATETKMEGGRTIYVKGSPMGYEKTPVTLPCGVLKSKYADAGQNADDKLLRGWVDVDEFYGGGPPPPLTGVNDKVFVGNDPANSGAAKTGAVAK